MRVCKMQLPHLGDGLKCVLLGPSKENVFLFISVELVTHILKVWWLCSLLWFLILAVACNSSEYKSAKCPPAGFVDRFQSCHWQVSNCKSATGRKRPSTAKETCFDYSRCEKWWFLRYMKLSYFLNTQNRVTAAESVVAVQSHIEMKESLSSAFFPSSIHGGRPEQNSQWKLSSLVFQAENVLASACLSIPS